MYNVMHTHFPVCFINIYTYINIVEGHKSSSDTIDRNCLYTRSLISMSVYIGFLLGILCIMSPCGVIIRCSELFCAESKTQVYAILHDLLHRNEKMFKDLGKKWMFICCGFF